MNSEQKAWKDYYMNKPTDIGNWYPEEVIGDQEQEDYDNAWVRLCEGFCALVILVGAVAIVKGCV